MKHCFCSVARSAPFLKAFNGFPWRSRLGVSVSQLILSSLIRLRLRSFSVTTTEYCWSLRPFLVEETDYKQHRSFDKALLCTQNHVCSSWFSYENKQNRPK